MLNSSKLSVALAIFAVFLFLSFILPIHDHPYRTYYHEVSAVVAVLLSMAVWACTDRVTMRIPHSVLLPFGLVVVIAIQISNGFILYPIDMFFPVLLLLCFAIAMVYGATMAKQENGLKQLSATMAYCFLAIGLISVLIQYIQILKLDLAPFVVSLSWSEMARPYANVAQPNLLALVLCFAVASAWYLFLEQQIKPWEGIFCVVFLLCGIALTQSRIGWLILPLYLCLCWKPAKNSPVIPKLLLVSLLLMFASLVFLVPHVMHYLGNAVNSVQERATQTSVRVVMWQQAWEMSLVHPWLGVGWYQFGTEQAVLAPLFAPTEYSNYAHNIVLNFAAEIGWPCTIIIFSSALYWFYHCGIRRWNHLSIRFISLMMLAVAVHSMVEYPLWHGFVLMPFGVMIGAVHSEKLKWEHVTIARGWVITFILACLISAVAMTWDYARVVKGFTALAWQQEAKKSGIGSIDKPAFTLYSQFYDYFHIIKINLDQNMAKSDLEFLERVAFRFSFQPVLSRLAIAYVNNHRPDQALHILLIIHRLHNDTYPLVYADWAELAKKDPAVCGEIFKRMPNPLIK